MGRRPILKSLHQVTELCLSRLFCIAEQPEHALLKLTLVDADGTRTQFPAIADQVIARGTHGAGVGLQPRQELGLGARERMVFRVPPTLFGNPLEQWEVDDLGKSKLLGVGSQIRLVGVVVGHGLVVGQTGKWCHKVPIGCHLLDNGHDQRLNQGQYIILLYEAHLQVQLGELWLTIGPQILVAEAARDLEVAIEPCHHQKLLHLLGRLRQGIELTRVDATRDQIVSGTLGCRASQHWGLNLKETPTAKGLAHRLDYPMTEQEVALQRSAAQIQVAVTQSKGFIYALGTINWERQGLGGIEDLDCIGRHLDLASKQSRIHRAARTRVDGTPNRDHVLISKRLRYGIGVGR